MQIDQIVWIGDSTVQTNRIDTWPQCGMGQVFELYTLPGVSVHNYARNGRSTKSFRDEGLWQPAADDLRPGSLLLIQFGHNDAKIQDPTRYAAPEQYAENLLAYANEAKARGALPVLITPLTRRHFAGNVLEESHGLYPDAMRALAAREGLPLIDLTAASRALVQQMGESATRALYMYFDAGLYPNYPDGKQDNTHLRYEGAVRFAGMVAEGLRALGAPYSDVLLDPVENN